MTRWAVRYSNRLLAAPFRIREVRYTTWRDAHHYAIAEALVRFASKHYNIRLTWHGNSCIMRVTNQDKARIFTLVMRASTVH